jgi:hypothetical protein
LVAFFIAVVAAVGAVWVGRIVDMRQTGEPSSFRRKVSLMLVGASAWTVTLIEVAHLLKLPGTVGPVQYWGDEHGNYPAMIDLQFVALLVS